jgi:hypothetical protein
MALKHVQFFLRMKRSLFLAPAELNARDPAAKGHATNDRDSTRLELKTAAVRKRKSKYCFGESLESKAGITLGFRDELND